MCLNRNTITKLLELIKGRILLPLYILVSDYNAMKKIWEILIRIDSPVSGRLADGSRGERPLMKMFR